MADVRAELECSVCLNTFTDPVNLTCGHTFCRLCIDLVLDTQERSGVYSCPECREEFVMRPTLHRNIALRKILYNVLSTDQEETRVLCTYCVDSSVPAIKSCLLCEAHLCEKHLRVHSKAPEHVLCDPTTSLERRKCSVHKKILEYYCPEDSACICLMCRIDGAHQGHHVDILDVASKNRKEKLRHVLERMLTMREETEKRVQSLKDYKRKSEEKADDERERVIALFRELRRQLEDLEKRVLHDISGQVGRVLLSLNSLIQELEIKKDELSRRMHDIEELCNMADPLTILQESDSSHLCNVMEGNYKQRCDKELQGDLDFVGVSHTLHKELSTVMTEIAKMMPVFTSSAMSSSLPLEEVRGTWDDNTGDILEELGAKVSSTQDQLQPNCETKAELYVVQPVMKVEEQESSSKQSKKEDACMHVFPIRGVTEEEESAEDTFREEEFEEDTFEETESEQVYFEEEGSQEVLFDEVESQEVWFGEEESQEVCFQEERCLDVSFEEAESQDVWVGEEASQEVWFGEERCQEDWPGEEESQNIWFGEEESQEVWCGEEESQEDWSGEEAQVDGFW